MKSFGQIMAFMLLCMSANAQQKVLYGGSFDFTPKEFTYDGNPLIQINSEDKISVYNDAIEVIKEIPVLEREYEYTLQYHEQSREIKSVNASLQEYLDREFHQDYTFDDYLADQRMLGGSEYAFVCKDLSDSEVMVYGYYFWDQWTAFFHIDWFGTQYPFVYFIYRKDENALYRVQANYSVEYTEWVDNGIRNEKYTKSTPLVEILYRNLDEGACHDGVEFYTSQTLFNDDEDFEYLVPKVTMLKGDFYSFVNPDVTYGQEPIVLQQSECITENATPAYTGFRILSSNGSVVGEIDFGGNYTMDDYELCFKVITIGGKLYLAADCVDRTKEETAYCTIFYQIDKQDGAIDRINIAPREAKVRQEDNTINVHLSSFDKPSVINVYNVGGAKVASQKANAGQESVSLNMKAPKGIYNITRVQDGRIMESQKVVLK